MPSKIVCAVAVTGKAHFETRLTARQHTATADEPEEDGGSDLGARPGEFLCMSLASCTAITLRMYAERKGWETGDITVSVTRIMNETDTDFKVEIKFENPPDASSMERLLAVSKKCPVHKVLTNPIRIESNIV